MKKMIYVFIILFMIIPLSLMAGDGTSEGTDTKTVRQTSSLSLVLPSGTFKMGFSSDTNRTKLTKPTFELNGNNLNYTSVITNKTSEDNLYVTATATFYVWWEALVDKGKNGVKIKLTASYYLKGSSDTDILPIVDKTKIGSTPDGATVPTIDATNETVTDDVVILKSDKVYSGYKKYILGYNLKNAKSDVTYKGTVSLSVVSV